MEVHKSSGQESLCTPLDLLFRSSLETPSSVVLSVPIHIRSIGLVRYSGPFFWSLILAHYIIPILFSRTHPYPSVWSCLTRCLTVSPALSRVVAPPALVVSVDNDVTSRQSSKYLGPLLDARLCARKDPLLLLERVRLVLGRSRRVSPQSKPDCPWHRIALRAYPSRDPGSGETSRAG